MDYKMIVKLADGIDLNGVKGKKALARKLMANGFNMWSCSSQFQVAMSELDVRHIQTFMRLVKSEDEVIEKYGCVGKKLIDAIDKCIDLDLEHHYFKNNSVGAQLKINGFSYLYSLFTYNESYNVGLLFKNIYNYEEKYVHLNDINDVNVCHVLTRLLTEKANEELSYREEKKWQGELNLENIAEELRLRFAEYQIDVQLGKRGCDTNMKPYKAIVIRKNNHQLGSLTLNVDERGIAVLSCRVPLCGEHSYDVTNDNIMDNIAEELRFMAN